MARIKWNAVGERRFETGVDRGVLYVEGSDGVPWNGLTMVSETPVGGEVTPYYIDGIKYLNHVAIEEFQGTIEAFTYPEEFYQCEGVVEVGHGLFAAHQRKKSFGLSYRTLVGNDIKGTNLAYKIHLVYDATANPIERQHETIGDTPEPFNFSWDISTKAPSIAGIRPTAHFIVDSRAIPIELLRTIENILYGSENVAPRLPSVAELLFIFEQYQTTVFDAGTLVDEYFETIDSGVMPEPYTATIDSNLHYVDFDSGTTIPEPSATTLDGGGP